MTQCLRMLQDIVMVQLKIYTTQLYAWVSSALHFLESE